MARGANSSSHDDYTYQLMAEDHHEYTTPDYEIEVLCGNKWKRVASFRKGAMSRFGKPFDDDVAKMEVESFEKHWFKDDRWIQDQRDFTKVRLIINL